jgi:hypothetical protein
MGHFSSNGLSIENFQNHPNDIQIQHKDPAPTADEESLFNFLNDSVSSSFVCSNTLFSPSRQATDIGKLEDNDESNMQTVFTEKRPATSRGSRLNNVKVCLSQHLVVHINVISGPQLEFMTLVTAIRKLLRAIPGRTSRVGRKVNTQQ